MLCNKAYYPNGTGENRERIMCSNKNNTAFGGKCPFIYWCNIDEKYENTADIINCIYKEERNDR